MNLNGCHDRAPFASTLTVQDGWTSEPSPLGFESSTRMPVMVEVPFRNEPTCQYVNSPMGKADPQCSGCRWKGQSNG